MGSSPGVFAICYENFAKRGSQGDCFHPVFGTSGVIGISKLSKNFSIEYGPCVVWMMFTGLGVVGSGWEDEEDGKSLARGRSRRLLKRGPSRPSRSSPSTRVRTTSPMGATSLLYVSNDVGCFDDLVGSQRGFHFQTDNNKAKEASSAFCFGSGDSSILRKLEIFR